MAKTVFNFMVRLCKTPSAVVLAQRELELAQRGLLEAHTSQEFAKRMAEYQNDRIKRLTAYLNGSNT